MKLKNKFINNKMRIIVVFFLILLSCNIENEFVRPWEDISKPIIIDVYFLNEYKIQDIIKDTRVKGIIHKLSEEDCDSYYQRRKEAYDNNLLFGSYWLPKYDSDGSKQADIYLEMIGYPYITEELIALDFEKHKKTGQFISPYNASLFVERIFEKTGRYPYIYCGINNLQKLVKSKYKDTFKKCSLWIVALNKEGNITKYFDNNNIWSTFSLWQFSCEINCCVNNPEKPCFYKILNMNCYIDYNVFNGSYEDLLKQWKK